MYSSSQAPPSGGGGAVGYTYCVDELLARDMPERRNNALVSTCLACCSRSTKKPRGGPPPINSQGLSDRLRVGNRRKRLRTW